MQEMKFCHYCGEKESLKINKYNDEYAVHCQHCGSIGPMAKDEEFAILKWNDRILEAPDMPQERPTIISTNKYDNLGCPIQGPDKPCNGMFCMMWVYVGDYKGRCGLVNTMYINSTGCGA